MNNILVRFRDGFIFGVGFTIAVAIGLEVIKYVENNRAIESNTSLFSEELGTFPYEIESIYVREGRIALSMSFTNVSRYTLSDLHFSVVVFSDEEPLERCNNTDMDQPIKPGESGQVYVICSTHWEQIDRDSLRAIASPEYAHKEVDGDA